MDFDLVLYIVVIIGSILWTVVKNLNKDEKERQAKKNVSRPVVAEPAGAPQRQPKEKPRSPFFQEENNNEPFSYETMSDRDFEQAFAQNAEMHSDTPQQESASPALNLSMKEEDVFKGIVWSEILKRKY